MRNFIFLIVVLCSTLLTGCVIQPVNPLGDDSDFSIIERETGDIAKPGALILKALDPLYIRFSGILEQQQLEATIDENGEISLLHLDPIMAAGLTPSQLASKIERSYIEGGIYKTVSVNVTMTAKVFYVQGEVNQPGQFPLSSGTTLLQAIAGARGYTPFAWESRVTITRHGKVYRFNMKDLEENPSLDVKIDAGDVIKVPQKPW
ncbi:polysaccharide biosynthesis/export family protein [Pontiella agarivorans]|uniref:SLBB domain-containing protein n=1 Tax=Pontiella agarivorans TaxID=3038953 RepID=A0ABU5N021_9BACT|nr:SLBB domain-containing protein [Pontiella agarivorans]MDZ8119774.1 SLBB domain-containing protein [Pontiella agarivorans]